LRADNNDVETTYLSAGRSEYSIAAALSRALTTVVEINIVTVSSLVGCQQWLERGLLHIIYTNEFSLRPAVRARWIFIFYFSAVGRERQLEKRTRNAHQCGRGRLRLLLVVDDE